MPRLDGFDGYHGQKDHGVDLKITLQAGLFWIAWKASQSTSYVDPTMPGIRSEWGEFRMRGLYHWLSSITDPAAQAQHYLATTGILPVGEFAMLDAEEAGITVAKCLAWCEFVENITHRPVVIYSGLYVAGGTIWNSPELRMSKYGARPFIVAAYVTEANLRARMTALGSKPFDGWQYSSNGPVPGVGTQSPVRCDMDQIDNVAAFELACEISHIVSQGVDDMLRLLVPTDNPAEFFAMCTPQGAALRCEWTGDLDRIEFYRNAHPADAAVPFEMSLTMAAFVNVSLDGPLPPGLTAEQFGNPGEIHKREDPQVDGVIDQVARSALTQLNDSVGRIGQQVGDIQTGLIKAGGG